MTPRIQATPPCTFASTAHAGCWVLRTVPHYRQNFDMVCAGEGVRAQSLIYSQQATKHFCRHYPEYKDYSVSSGHPITVIYSKSYY